MPKYPEIVWVGDHVECSEHGDTVAPTVGQWTGRVMDECVVCGAYIVKADQR